MFARVLAYSPLTIRPKGTDSTNSGQYENLIQEKLLQHLLDVDVTGHIISIILLYQNWGLQPIIFS